MNVVFTCGGTGGHINPAIAVANIWKERHPDSRILFIGGDDNMEGQLVPKAGYRLVTMEQHGIIRGKSFSAIRHNIHAVYTTAKAVRKCKKILKQFGADVVIGTGGYASFSALMAASRLKIPTFVHESNALPGLTTRMIANYVDKVLVCFPVSAKYYKDPKKVEVVGMPVRREFIFTQREDARRELKLDERPVILSSFGSQGAKAMNEVIAQLFCLERDAGFPYQHIHAVGSYGWEWMPDHVRSKGVDPDAGNGLCMREYIYNMPTVMAAADIIISRAGSASCNEIAASGTPCILVPSPNVTDNHQYKNAKALADRGAAVLLSEEDCTAQALFASIQKLLADKEAYQAMRKSLLSMSVPDSADRLCDMMEQAVRKHRK